LFAGCHGAFCEKSIIYACHVIFRQKSTKTERKEINPTKPSQTIMSWVAQKQKKNQKKNEEICAKMAKNSNVTASSNRIFPVPNFTPHFTHRQHFPIR